MSKLHQMPPPPQPQQPKVKTGMEIPSLADITNTLTTLIARYCLAHAQFHPLMQKQVILTLREIFPFDQSPQKTPADIQLIIQRHAQDLLDELKILMLRQSIPSTTTEN
jgi:hypothetical protein